MERQKKTMRKEDAKCENDNPLTGDNEKIQNKTKTEKEIISKIKNNQTKDNGSVPSLFTLAYSKWILHFQTDFEQNTAKSKAS